MYTQRCLSALALAVFFVLASGVQTTAAQEADDSQWTFDGRGGATVPVGDFSDLPVDDLGTALGAGIGYRVHPRVTLRVDGDVEVFTGDPASTGSEEGLGSVSTVPLYAGMKLRI